MLVHPDVAYWDHGARNVPQMTGSAKLLDAHDLRAICEALEIPLPLSSVLDVGCGTGRLALLADEYLGADITQAAVDYCAQHGRSAVVIMAPEDLPLGPFDYVTAISLFTHISRSDRQAYLAAFVDRAPRLLVDIIPGDGSGDVALWTARPDDLTADLDAAGYDVVGVTDHQWDRHLHRYYLAGRRA